MTRTNVAKNENFHLVTDWHSILSKRKNHFSQLLNVIGVNDVRQTEIYKAESLLSGSGTFEFAMDIERLKRSEPPGTDQIPK